MKLIWLTDIHLNFLDYTERMNFYEDIIKMNADAVLISGDIAEASSISEFLHEMRKQIQKTLYFVLGNHDYYKGRINDVRQEMTLLTQRESMLQWLPASGIKQFNKEVVLIGQDGWADGRLGDYQNSYVSLNDSRMIADLLQQKILGKNQLLQKMQQLADQDATQLAANLIEAIKSQAKKIIILTHVPPFKEACLYEGKMSSNDYLPYFSSKASGDVLLKAAKENIGIKFLVFCGHTHHKSLYQPLANLIVQVGQAEYAHPEVQACIEI